ARAGRSRMGGAILPRRSPAGADAAGDRPCAPVSAAVKQVAQPDRASGDAQRPGAAQAPGGGANPADFAPNGPAAQPRWPFGFRLPGSHDWTSVGRLVSGNENPGLLGL